MLLMFSSMYQKHLILIHILLYCTKFLIHLGWLGNTCLVKIFSYMSYSIKINSKIHSNLFSQLSSVTSGVIQGSVLRRLLYAAYTNGIIRCFSYDCPILYADDLKVLFPIDPSDFPKSFSLIMNDLNASFASFVFNCYGLN